MNECLLFIVVMVIMLVQLGLSAGPIINEVIFKLYSTENSTVIWGDCELSLRSLSQ